jgi:hypothetical protein
MRPVVNSHYARQLNMWGIPVALAGQQLDARDPRGATLRFDRRDRSMRRCPPLAIPTPRNCSWGPRNSHSCQSLRKIFPGPR